MLTTTLLGLAFTLSARGVAADGTSDENRIQGTWIVSPATFDGVPDMKTRAEGIKMIAGMQFIFQGSEVTIKHVSCQHLSGKESQESGSFRLDPTKTPKQIDLGPNVLGIYELKGRTLKLCLDIRGKENGRPVKFGFVKDKPTVVYYVLKREKK